MLMKFKDILVGQGGRQVGSSSAGLFDVAHPGVEPPLLRWQLMIVHGTSPVGTGRFVLLAGPSSNCTCQLLLLNAAVAPAAGVAAYSYLLR